MEPEETKGEVEMAPPLPLHVIRFAGIDDDAAPPEGPRPGGISRRASSHAASLAPHGLPKLLPAFSRPPDLNLPPGVAPVDEFLSLFCTVSAVALTLLATGLPLQATTPGEEERVRQALMYYALCATTVYLFWFKMQGALEHAVILLAIDQVMLGLWLLALVLLPVFLGRVIRWHTGSIARFGARLLLADYLLLAVVNLGFDASLNWHPHHKAMVFPKGQAARRRRLRNGAVGFVGLLVLGLLELLLANNFLHAYILLVPLLLTAEQAYDMHQSKWHRHHKDKSPPHDNDQGAMFRPRNQDGLAPQLHHAESADSSIDSDSENDSDAEDDVEAGGAVVVAGAPMGSSNLSTTTAPPTAPALENPPSLLSSLASFISPLGPHRLRAPQQSEHPCPRRVAAHVRLPIWYALRVKRIGEVRDLYCNVTGTALTLLSTMLPFLHDDEASHFKRFKTCLFMYFWAALTVLLYYVRMRQLMSFRRFLFLPELILLCVWMTLIVLIPQFMEAVALYGGGHGAVRAWTPAQTNNTRLLVVHVLLDTTTLLFASSLLYWKRKVGRSRAREKALGPSGASRERGGSGFSLAKIVAAEATKLGFMVVLLACQICINGFSNQYLYIIPSMMAVCEGYVHFFARAGQ